MAIRTTLDPDQGPDFGRIRLGDTNAVSDGMQLIWNRLLTDAYAFARKEDPNSFHKNQEIAKVRPSLQMRYSGDTVLGRYFQAIAGAVYVTINADFDGGNWNRDDIALPQWILAMNVGFDGVAIARAPAGANPSTGVIVSCFQIDNVGRLYERARTTPIGNWIPFVPAFTSNGTGTVTLTLTQCAKYTLIGSTMICLVNVQVTMAGAGAGDNVISFTVPGGFGTTADIQVGYGRISDPGTGIDGPGVSFTVGTPKFNIAKVPTAAFANGAGLALQLSISCEVV